METIVKITAPRGAFDFALKLAFTVIVGNLFSMLIIYSRHGNFPSGLDGQIFETTIIATPFAIFFLATIGYMRQLQLQFAKIAATDVLTGLPNRRAFLTDTQAALDAGQAGHIVLVDADHFKAVNDTYGHDVGDMCLIAIADHLRALIQTPALVGRLGGEEFALFLPNNHTPNIIRLSQAICAPIIFNTAHPQTATVTLSAGVVATGTMRTLTELLADADKALYRAKASGRARCDLANLTFDPAKPHKASPKRAVGL